MSAFAWSDDHAEGVDFGQPQPEAFQEVHADPALAADADRRLAVQEDMNFRANNQAELSAQARKRLASPNTFSKHKPMGERKAKASFVPKTEDPSP